MGAWTLVVDSPQGPFEQELTLKDEEGKVVAVITSQIQPDGQRITDVAKVGADLVLKFAGNFQGNAFDAKITVDADRSRQGDRELRRQQRSVRHERYGYEKEVGVDRRAHAAYLITTRPCACHLPAGACALPARRRAGPRGA